MSSTVTMTVSARPKDDKNPPLVDFNYHKPPRDGSSPAENDMNLLFGLDETRKETYKLPVYDARGREDKFSLDTQGFCFRHHDTSLDFKALGQENITNPYEQELLPLLRKRFPNASKIWLIGAVLRTQPKYDPSATIDKATWWESIKKGQPPGPNVHIDWTPKSVLGIAQNFLDDEAVSSIRDSGRRYIGLSLWRPITKVKRDPLAYMNARTISPDQNVVIPRKRSKGFYYENLLVKAGNDMANHRCYWKSNQDTHEMTLIKLCDSQTPDSAVSGTPHSSFRLPGTENESLRESVEIRAIVLF